MARELNYPICRETEPTTRLDGGNISHTLAGPERRKLYSSYILCIGKLQKPS